MQPTPENEHEGTFTEYVSQREDEDGGKEGAKKVETKDPPENPKGEEGSHGSAQKNSPSNIKPIPEETHLLHLSRRIFHPHGHQNERDGEGEKPKKGTREDQVLYLGVGDSPAQKQTTEIPYGTDIEKHPSRGRPPEEGM